MPKARVPKAPWVLVWLSPQAMVRPGWVQAEFRADDVDHALPRIELVVIFDAELARVLREMLDLQAALRIGDGAPLRSVVWML